MKKDQALKTLRKHNFSLLELLVVISILAIIAGSLLTAYDGLQAQAAKSQAANDIAAIDRAVRTFTAVEKIAPENLDSLVQADYKADAGFAKTRTAATATHFEITTSTDGGPQNVKSYVETAPTAAEIADAALQNPVVTITVPAAKTHKATAGVNLAASNSEFISLATSKLRGKFQVINLSKDHASVLSKAGINNIRYADNAGFATYPGDFKGPNHTVAGVRWTKSGETEIVAYAPYTDIPNRIFDNPTTGKNRGRGYSSPVVENTPVAIWKPGTLGANTAKVGGKSYESPYYPGSYVTSVLVGFGLGNNASIIGAKNETGNVGDVTIASAPTYGDVQRHEYGRYVLLYNVGEAYINQAGNGTESSFETDANNQIKDLVSHSLKKAKLVAVVDTRGDFLDEELAEASGQKQ